VSDAGYRTTVPVHVAGGADLAAPEPAPLWEEGEVPVLTAEPEPVRHRRVDSPEARVLERLVAIEHASVPELARALELSASTVLRALRVLVEQRRVERQGFARATRYRPRA
jgi:hypothetical protein